VDTAKPQELRRFSRTFGAAPIRPVDAGQSFYLGDTRFRNKRRDRVEYPFDLSELRVSTGIAVQWLSPMGLFRFSYAYPLKYQDETRRQFGDEIEEFQFSVGTAF